MTDKTIDWSSGKPERMAGWFSWRHKKSSAHEVARATYQANRGPESRRLVASQRVGEVVTMECGHRSSKVDHPCEVKA